MRCMELMNQYPDCTAGIANVHYSIALCSYRIGRIIRDKENTDNSKQAYSLTSYTHSIHFEEAISHLEKAISQFPHKDFLNLLGIIYSLLEQFDKALFYFNRSLEVSYKDSGKYDSSAVYNKGWLLYKDKRYHEALDLFHDSRIVAEKQQPDLLSIQGMADCLLNLRHYREALEYYDNSFNEFDDIYSAIGYMICLVNLGSFYKAEKKIDDIFIKYSVMIPILDNQVEQLDKLTIQGKNWVVESMTIKAYILLRTNRTILAKTYLEEAEKIIYHYRLDLIAPLFLRGVVLVKEKEYDKALEIFENIQLKKEDFAPAHYCAGICHCNLGAYDQGVNEFRNALKFQPDYTPAHLDKQQVEAQMTVSKNDFMSYWTSSKSKTLVFFLLISFGFIVTIVLVTHPNQEITDVKVWNNTPNMQNPQDYVSRTSTTKSTSSFTYVSVALIIGIILLILWPSIKSFKFGVNTIEVERLDYPERLTELSIDWLSVDTTRESFSS